MDQERKRYQIIPAEELRCVWMTANVLTYQLCDREYECDSCPLDAAMRRGFPQAMPQAPAPPAASPRPAADPESLLYSRHHCRLQGSGDSSYRVGIEKTLAAVLLAVKTVVLPSAGQLLRQDQSCAWLVMDGGTLPIRAPAAGRVRALNAKLAENPHLVQEDSLADGWLYELEADASALAKAHLLRSGEAQAKFAKDEARFEAALQKALRGNRPAVGFTLADGGVQLRHCAEMLGPGRYFNLVRRIFA